MSGAADASPPASPTIQLLRLPAAAAPDPIDPPTYTTDGAAGMDLRAAVRAPLTLAPGARVRVPTGFAIAIPTGFEGQVRPRSGWAARHGVTVLNAPGTIDADYRGELQILLVNLGEAAVQIERGDRVAQLVIAPVSRAEVALVTELRDTGRGSGGFGHTGLKRAPRFVI